MKDHKNSPIALEGLTFIIPVGAVALAAFFFGATRTAVLLSVATLFVVWFFRNPARKTPEDAKAIISPADGTVLKIEDVIDNEMVKGPFKKISIFMSIFNVHVNRVPVSGTVNKICYKEGKFLSANLDKASSLNERNSILVKTDDGKYILTVQIAGLIARRIVCWLKEGMYVIKGERFGLIQFGSRLELFLPFDTTISVRVGDKVKAGTTTIGYLT
ncbi:MAG: phosphatidylserine decarboxylase family protein [Syntrophales bacterium]